MLFKSAKIVSLFLVVMSFLFSSEMAFASNKQEKQNCKNTVSGLYVGKIPGLTTFTMSNTPLNSSHDTMLIVIDTTGDADPTSRGLFPTAIGQSNPRGQLIRDSGKEKIYHGQLVRYRYNNIGDVVSTEIQGVSMEILDCKTVEVSFVAEAFYFGYVNPGMDELPVPDIIVDVSGFPSFEAKRIIIDHEF